MNLIRTSKLLFALSILLLASLACAQLSQPPATSAPAVVSPTDTPQATVQSDLILDEKFVDNSNNWYVGNDDLTEADIVDGNYKVRVLAADKYTWFDSPVTASEVDVTVDVEFTDGAPENAAYGLICHNKDADNHYRLLISPDGSYAIDKIVKGRPSYLANWTISSAINPGVQVANHMRVICSERHLILYVNDTLLADVTDKSLTGGTFSLVASWPANKKEDTNPVGVNFSNLLARKPAAWVRPAGSLLNESFDENKGDWDVFQTDTASAQIENGQLVFKTIKTGTYHWSHAGLSLDNVDMSFDVIFQAGTPSNTSFGAICRYSDADNYYLFDMAADGNYGLSKMVNGKAEKIISWKTSTAFKPGIGETNHLRVVCSGSNLELYINDTQVIASQDATLTAGGIALQAGRFSENEKPVSVAFDNFEAHYPEK